MLFRDLIERHDVPHPRAVSDLAYRLVVNTGHLLENLTFTALRRVTPEIHYYKSRTGREVDFVARRRDGSRLLVQVCESLADPRTRRRELAALEDAMAELNLRSSVLVTWDGPGRQGEDSRITVDSGAVEVVAAWRFLLDLS